MKMNRIAKYMIISALLVIAPSVSNAQEHNEQVTVEGSYRPQIKRSERLVKMPGMPDNEFNIPNYKAKTKDFDYGYDLDVETMSATPYISGSDKSGKENFLKAALGTRLSPVLSFHHSSDLTKTMSLNFGVGHYSSWISQKDYKKSTFMNNDINVVTINKFKSGQLSISGDYHYDMYHLRSYDNVQGDAVTNNNGRNIHSVKVGAKWTSVGTSYRQLYQEYSGDYRYVGIVGGTNENQANLKARLAYSDNWINNKNVDNVQTINADVNVNYNYVYKSLFILALKPNFCMSGSFYNVRLGFDLDFKTDDKVGIYPDLKGSFFLINNDLELYAKLGGQARINTFESIVKENPFVTTNFNYLSDFGYEKTNIDLDFGGKVNIINAIDVRVGARYRIVKNGLFYIPDFDFYVKYDKNDALYHLQAFDVIFKDYNLWNVMFDAYWKINEKAFAGMSFVFNRYSIDYAYYKPNFEMTLSGGYNLGEFWRFNASMLIMGKRRAVDENGDNIKLNPAADIKLGADYQINEDFSAFAEIHNLIHNKYQLYYNYPSMGFELFLGVKYKF